MPLEKLASLDGGERSSAIRTRIKAARVIQAERFVKLGKANMLINGDMGPAEVQLYCAIDEAPGAFQIRGDNMPGTVQ